MIDLAIELLATGLLERVEHHANSSNYNRLFSSLDNDASFSYRRDINQEMAS